MVRLHVIMGCTAGGKGALAAELARRHHAQILSVDSMKVYRGMDIGTAKPPRQVRQEIPFHGIDVVDPWEPFTVAQYLRLAEEAIERISRAGSPVLAVGGTGLYLKALTDGLFEGPGESAVLREELRAFAEREGLPALHAELSKVDPAAAGRIHPNDLRRMVRALEVHRLTGRPISELQRQWKIRDASQFPAGQAPGPGGERAGNWEASLFSRFDGRMILLRRDKADANGRINARVRRMIDEGLVEEVRRLLADPRGLTAQASAALGYAETIRHFRGELTLDEAVEQIKINTRRFAKNQRTWFRRFQQALPLDVAADATVAAVADEAGRLLELT